MLCIGAQRPIRVLCARETQKSIADSVHKLLSDQIKELGLQSVYTIQKAMILGPNGTEFIFAGLRHNVNNIKSVEACDIVWVEEAQAVSRQSWDVLVPTVRKDGSEIWVSFNPDLATDETYQRFVVKEPPPGAFVQKLNYLDNPWFPDVLRAEMEHDQRTDPAKFAHVWEGQCQTAVEGAIYEAELRKAESDNRITRVPYDPARPVHTFWDLGFADSVAIWMAQSTGFEYHLIDYVEDSQKALNHYLQELQKRSYVWGTDYLPWDGKAKNLGSGKSIEELIRATGRKVAVVTRLQVVDGINAARTIFPQCYFDAEKCADGLQGLRHYRWGPVGTDGQQKREPLHDWASHPADAFRAFAVAMKHPEKEYREPEAEYYHTETSWMGN